MAWTRWLGFAFCAWAAMTTTACSSRSREMDTDRDAGTVLCVTGADGSPLCLCVTPGGAPTCWAQGPGGRPCDCLGDGDGDGGAEADAASTEGGDDPSATLNGADLFLGTWTLSGTEQYVCSNELAGEEPVTNPVTLTRGTGVTDSGSIDLMFDPGLGCALPMSVSGAAARLMSPPQLCSVRATPIDRQFTSVEISPLGSVFIIEETFGDHTGCQYRVQGWMSP
jgi:hypothetical protein